MSDNQDLFIRYQAMPYLSTKKYLFAIVVAIQLSACVSVPRDQPLASRNDAGLLLASVRVSHPDMDMDGSTFFQWATISYRPDKEVLHLTDRTISSRTAEIAIEGEKFAKINVVALAPGDYSIVGVQSMGNGDSLKRPIKFTIRPGRVTYLGMLHVRRLDHPYYRLIISDEQDRDIPLFLNDWSRVTRDLIDVNIPRSP